MGLQAASQTQAKENEMPKASVLSLSAMATRVSPLPPPQRAAGRAPVVPHLIEAIKTGEFDGMSIAKIARKFGCSTFSVCKAKRLIEQGQHVQPQAKPMPQQPPPAPAGRPSYAISIGGQTAIIDQAKAQAVHVALGTLSNVGIKFQVYELRPTSSMA